MKTKSIYKKSVVLPKLLTIEWVHLKGSTSARLESVSKKATCSECVIFTVISTYIVGERVEVRRYIRLFVSVNLHCKRDVMR